VAVLAPSSHTNHGVCGFGVVGMRERALSLDGDRPQALLLAAMTIARLVRSGGCV
jgi:hypothetical protein